MQNDKYQDKYREVIEEKNEMNENNNEVFDIAHEVADKINGVVAEEDNAGIVTLSNKNRIKIEIKPYKNLVYVSAWLLSPSNNILASFEPISYQGSHEKIANKLVRQLEMKSLDYK